VFDRGLCERLWALKRIYHKEQIARFGFDPEATKDRVRGYAEQYPEFFCQL